MRAARYSARFNAVVHRRRGVGRYIRRRHSPDARWLLALSRCYKINIVASATCLFGGSAGAPCSPRRRLFNVVFWAAVAGNIASHYRWKAFASFVVTARGKNAAGCGDARAWRLATPPVNSHRAAPKLFQAAGIITRIDVFQTSCSYIDIIIKQSVVHRAQISLVLHSCGIRGGTLRRR